MKCILSKMNLFCLKVLEMRLLHASIHIKSSVLCTEPSPGRTEAFHRISSVPFAFRRGWSSPFSYYNYFTQQRFYLEMAPIIPMAQVRNQENYNKGKKKKETRLSHTCYNRAISVISPPLPLHHLHWSSMILTPLNLWSAISTSNTFI